MNHLIGVDVGGTKVGATLAVLHGDLLKGLYYVEQPTSQSEHPLAIGDQIISLIGILLRQPSIQREEMKIGCSCAGPMYMRRSLQNPPNIRAGLGSPDGIVPIADPIEEYFGIPTIAGNDGKCAALAEYVFRTNPELLNLIYFTISTGIGGGVIDNGRLIQGVHGNAFEAGHIDTGPSEILSIYGLTNRLCNCKKKVPNCAEAWASGRAIEEIARYLVPILSGDNYWRDPIFYDDDTVDSFGIDISRIDTSKINTGHVFKAAKEGDPIALSIIENAIEIYRKLIAISITAFNPQAVLIGGGIAAAQGDYLFNQIFETLPPYIQPTLWHAIEYRGSSQLGPDIVGRIAPFALLLDPDRIYRHDFSHVRDIEPPS